MKILILHGIDSMKTSRRTSLHHAFFLMRHFPDNEYWLQAASAPVTDDLVNEDFDAIIIDTTFLCWRWAKPIEAFEAFRRKYEFVAKSDAIKVAFPQDDYDHSEILDEWLSEWKVNVVYSVLYPHRAELYPCTSKTSEILKGYTGLFEAADLTLISGSARPWGQRAIDVGYRARRLPAYFGRFGQVKSEIADRFAELASITTLKLDISCKPSDTISGDQWLQFLGNCRFTLGSESGSSILDPRGEIRVRCEEFSKLYGEATFEEIEAACFPGQDRISNPFKALSPRIFEAAAAGCAQILVPSEYDGALQPWTHYLPLERDCSNFDKILDAMGDTDRIQKMIDASQKALIANTRYSYAYYSEDVLGQIRKRLPKKHPSSRTAMAEPFDNWLKAVLQTNERWAKAWPRWWMSR